MNGSQMVTLTITCTVQQAQHILTVLSEEATVSHTINRRPSETPDAELAAWRPVFREHLEQLNLKPRIYNALVRAMQRFDNRPAVDDICYKNGVLLDFDAWADAYLAGTTDSSIVRSFGTASARQLSDALRHYREMRDE
jgi:hypothetical protein